MPVYEYECLSCQKVHEILQKFSDPPLAECPDCRSKVKKLMSLNSFSLKGGGWYASDYKKTAKPIEKELKPTTVSTPSSEIKSPAPTPPPENPLKSRLP